MHGGMEALTYRYRKLKVTPDDSHVSQDFADVLFCKEVILDNPLPV